VKPISEDGRRVFGLAGAGDVRVCDVESGEEVLALKIPPGERGDPLACRRPVALRLDAGRVSGGRPPDPSRDGEREDWRKLLPADPTGVMSTRFVVMTPDGETCAMSYIKILSQLHVLRGIPLRAASS